MILNKEGFDISYVLSKEQIISNISPPVPPISFAFSICLIKLLLLFFLECLLFCQLLLNNYSCKFICRNIYYARQTIYLTAIFLPYLLSSFYLDILLLLLKFKFRRRWQGGYNFILLSEVDILRAFVETARSESIYKECYLRRNVDIWLLYFPDISTTQENQLNLRLHILQ